ncbi:unnamed protein product, partial [Porites evermanni]
KLAGKTIFITGASRGIGKAIALKAAQDGANIVIAAKTTEPHPKLPGTIYTAAREGKFIVANNNFFCYSSLGSCREILVDSPEITQLSCSHTSLHCRCNLTPASNLCEAASKSLSNNAPPHCEVCKSICSCLALFAVETAGGKCLPCAVDIRDEDAVNKAVQDAVKKFGGIDILVNNASAISLTGTLDTPMKRYDLMNSINARGTFLCSQACLPYLKTAKNPHILNISPPLNMKPYWFKSHVAYTMAKYGMSMCVLGMAEEFKDVGISVNALWPKTGLLSIRSKIAVHPLCNFHFQPLAFSLHAYVLKSFVTRSYPTANRPSNNWALQAEPLPVFLTLFLFLTGSKLLPDFFLDVEGYDPQEMLESQKKMTQSASQGSSGEGVAQIFDKIKSLGDEELVRSVNGVFEFHLEGKEPGVWFVDLKNNSGNVGSGSFPGGDANCTMNLDSEDFVKMFKGELNPTQAFMGGKLKIKGDMMLAMKLEKLMGKMKSKL